ncbi:MAG: iron-sulfur cluster assembly accessory protein [Gammaproteobacteria bacterium]|nr:iron-sulfur cluster assembly accessory protein [Gammaproteobacteria bacterium]
MSTQEFNSQLNEEINMSDEAVSQMLTILDNEPDAEGVRIFVSGGGCSGMTYGMTLIQQPSDYDAYWEKNGLKVYIDVVALSFLEGVEIDYQTEGLNQSFVFKNVFANSGGSGSCGGCGSAGH